VTPIFLNFSNQRRFADLTRAVNNDGFALEQAFFDLALKRSLNHASILN
jgi:hypothetical protein